MGVGHATPITRATGYEQGMEYRAGMVGLDGYSAPGCVGYSGCGVSECSGIIL